MDMHGVTLLSGAGVDGIPRAIFEDVSQTALSPIRSCGRGACFRRRESMLIRGQAKVVANS